MNENGADIVKTIEESGEMKVNTDMQVFLYNTDGSKIYIDTHSKVHTQEGQTPTQDQRELFEKMKDVDTLNTRQLMKDKMKVLSVAKNIGKKYALPSYEIVD